MTKEFYLNKLLDELSCEDKNRKLYSDILDVVDIALSQECDNFEISSPLTFVELYKIIENYSKENKLKCVGPFEAAELFSKKFNSNYKRYSKRLIINLEDFL
ncbi:MAG: hypothetical protein IJ997_00840 [Mycoplasmataceae bacterium]|nr:hypothetical protein [Mycoplasmataceae bacterium]MBR4025606.1 hypothetical protein [Mycoplasmataceae bacterium]